MDSTIPRLRLLGVAAMVLSLLVTALVVAGSAGGEPGASTSASVNKQLRKLKKRVKRLERRQGEPRPPAGPAGGDLAGSYPNPSIAAGSLGAGEFSSSIPAAHVTRTSNQSIPFQSNDETTLQFDAERYDTAGMHDPAIDSRLTAPITGIYAVTAQVWWETGPGDFRSLAVRRNGITSIARAVMPPMASGATTQEVHAQVRLQAGEYVEAKVFHNDGNGTAILVLTEASPEFSMTWLAPGP